MDGGSADVTLNQGNRVLTERSLFAALFEIDDPAQRLAYLDQACAGSPELRLQVEQLLDAYDSAGNFMQRSARELVGGDGDKPPLSEGPGTVIGHYKLLEQIGEGGFGVVFMAEQQRPVRRLVAVKVLKAGMESRQVVARFEAERQALALMDHPHIAHVLDAGETNAGRPFFVMELVGGVPITEYCNAKQLSVAERLKLFLEVCGAVQHAHQKGIIHRDLKPSNLLVTIERVTPIVKVIDFGIAKAIGRPLTEKTLLTGFAQLIGTPTYMSPEQARMGGLDVDTRTDVYSLGVLLYELLTGTTPFERDRLAALEYDEIRRVIRDEEPPRPSTRISTPGSEAETAFAGRSSDRKHLSQSCRGELDWIVMKALEKDRNRRYDSVGAFADDVERYLCDDPVQACPPSRWYQFRKLVRRHKRVFIAVTALTVAVLLTVAGLAVSNVRVSREQVRTQVEKERADRAQKLAEERATDIQRGLERLKAANDLIERARWYMSVHRLDDANHALRRAAELRPDHAAVWVELSDLHTRLGLWDLAANDFAREFELREPESTSRWHHHAVLNLWLDHVDGFVELRRKMHDRFRGTMNYQFLIDVIRTSALSADPDTEVEAMTRLAERLFAGDAHEWHCLYVSGLVACRAGQYDRAVERLSRASAVSAHWPVRPLNLPMLALAQHRLGQTAAARETLAQAGAAIEAWTREVYGKREDGSWVHHLGGAVTWPVAWWDWLECQLLYREVKRIIDGVPVKDDPRHRVLRARAFAALRDHVRADEEYSQAMRELPDEAPIRLEAIRNRGYRDASERRWPEAVIEFARATTLQPDEPRLWLFQAIAQAAAGQHVDWQESCESMLSRFERTTDSSSACVVVRTCALFDAPPADLSARLLELARVGAPFGYFGAYVEGAALYRAGRYEEALRCFEDMAPLYQWRAWDWCFMAMAHHRLAHVEDARRCLAEAERWIDRANRVDLDDIAGNSPAWGDWPERVEYSLLLREAEALLNQPPARGAL